MREDWFDSGRCQPWGRTLGLIEPILALADRNYIHSIRSEFARVGIDAAVADHDSAAIFDWLLATFQYQGMSDRSVEGFAKEHGAVGWDDLASATDGRPRCNRLWSYWHFHDCGYRKRARTCAEPHNLHDCPLPGLPLRNGRLSQNAFALYFFMRDVCDGDLVGWIDDRLGQVAWERGQDGSEFARAILEPMGYIHGVSSKVLSMALADLLLGADPKRDRWVAAGASMIAIDSLVHNFFHRTGTLARHGAEHPYGDRCYQPGGCIDLVRGIADRFDARTLNPDYPERFSRLVQHSIWAFCAQSQWNICNGNQINDRVGCRNRLCVCWDRCGRKVIPRLVHA